MPYYNVDVFELHSMTYTIKAKNREEAVDKALNGKGDPSDDGSDYMEVALKYGNDAKDLGVDPQKCGEIVYGIHNIEEIDDDDDEEE